MSQLILLIASMFCLVIGTILGYYARQSIARKQSGTLEAKLQKKTQQAQKLNEDILSEAREKASKFLEAAEKERHSRRLDLTRTEKVLLSRENLLENKIVNFERKEDEFYKKVDRVKEIKRSLENSKEKILHELERVSGLSKEVAKKELLTNVETEYQKEILERIKKLETEGNERFDKRAKEMIAFAVQKCALSQAQEITTTTVSLPSDDIKGRIIGKEGRNIRTLEKLTGVEIIVDETPEAVIISGFDPIRRQTAKLALEKLIHDGRIQPARIEDVVAKTEKEIISKIEEAGEAAIYDVGIIGLDPRLVRLLGRLRYRTSYGQNVLLHSVEVAYLAEALASELGANTRIAQKAGLLHDIGKAVDHQVQGSHVDIGMKILEKFKVEKEVIDAMKSHHEDYPYESIEAVIVQVADQISGARPGARKDTLENYLKRLQELEDVATSFSGVEKAYAIQAGREIRIFVKPSEIDDLGMQKLAKDVANMVQEELRYPGQIKINVIRENRVVEYAK